jgi:hypothetical protein
MASSSATVDVIDGGMVREAAEEAAFGLARDRH